METNLKFNPKEFEEKINAQLDDLPATMRKVLEMRFGIKDGVRHTLKAVGQEIGQSSEQVRRLEQKALRKLRHPRKMRLLAAQAAPLLFRDLHKAKSWTPKKFERLSLTRAENVLSSEGCSPYEGEARRLWERMFAHRRRCESPLDFVRAVKQQLGEVTVQYQGEVKYWNWAFEYQGHYFVYCFGWGGKGTHIEVSKSMDTVTLLQVFTSIIHQLEGGPRMEDIPNTAPVKSAYTC